jgi:hypothetical protein
MTSAQNPDQVRLTVPLPPDAVHGGVGIALATQPPGTVIEPEGAVVSFDASLLDGHDPGRG